jgi:hypothetical protein
MIKLISAVVENADTQVRDDALNSATIWFQFCSKSLRQRAAL